MRLLMLCLLLLAGLLAAMGNRLFAPTLYPPLKQGWFYLVARALGIGIERHGEQALYAQNTSRLLVCNHISWADIVVIGATVPSVVFLSKHEVGNWPVIGLLVRMAGTLFIKRGEDANAAMQLIEQKLQAQGKVVIFPEGRTSMGHSVKRFFPRLFKAAELANRPVQPLAIRYLDAQGVRVEDVSFADERHFIRSLWDTLCHGRIQAQLLAGEVIDATCGRDELARKTHDFALKWVENSLTVDKMDANRQIARD